MRKYSYKHGLTWRKYASTIHEAVKDIPLQPTVKIKAISLPNYIVQVFIEETKVKQETKGMEEVVDYEIVEEPSD